MNKFCLVALFLFLFSCIREEKVELYLNPIKTIQAEGLLIPTDSLLSPQLITVEKSNINVIPLRKTKVIPTNTNVLPMGSPKIFKTEKPRVCKPGQDGFIEPNKVKAIPRFISVGQPELVFAKDAYTKDQNPENFSSFSKLQGLTHTNITYLYEDNLGNLWLGTGGGGVSKFDGKTFTHFSEQEGLTNNFITCILQDKTGNLWFGTESGGVSRYNGRTFANFTEKEGLSNNFVTCILQDKMGNIWLGTKGGGLTKYEGNTFTHFTEKQGLSSNFITSIIEDSKGNLWLTTKDSGMVVYDGKKFNHYTEKQGLPSNKLTSILQDQSGNIWVGTNNKGVFQYDGVNFKNFTTSEGLSNNFVTTILQDNSGDLWFGTNGEGVSRYNFKTFTHFTEMEGLNNNIIRHIIQDKNGILWIGKGSGGVSKYNYKSFKHFTEKEGLSNSIVLSISEDKIGNIWFGTEGGGVSVYNGNSFTHFTTKDGLSDNIVYNIIQDKQGNFWFGTNTGISKYDGKTFTQFKNIEGLSNNIVYSILEDKKGYLWFGTDGGGAFKFDGKSFTKFTIKNGLSSNSVRTIFQDKSGNIWFGTYGGGAAKYDGKSFTHYTKKQGMPNNFVRSIIQDRSGNLWFGSLGFNGLTRFNGNNFISFTEKEGLSNNVVCSIHEDKSGNIWCGTRFGLSKISNEKLKKINETLRNKINIESKTYFESYTYDDGFLGVGCNSNAMYSTKDGTLWIGANDRLSIYHSSVKEDVFDTIHPNIQLTGIELFNENIPWGKLKNNKDTTLVLGNGVAICDFQFDSVAIWYGYPENLILSYQNNHLTFNFIGITTARPKKVKYQYKLDGMDENWSAITTRNEASYGNLLHGTYTFRVKAMNAKGYWSNEFCYTFSIRPPWWKTWWFRLLVAITTISSVVFYIKWREGKLKKEKIILAKTVKERTTELIQKNILIKEQKKIVEEKAAELAIRHKEITDSINYAERIQKSFLATKNHLDENLKEYFIFFKPKDVVSGDFYWSATLNNGNFILCTADSTGHGVPGAIMSLLNITSLEKAIESYNSPEEILNATRKIIIERLKRDGSADGGKDGMDASLCVYDFRKLTLQVSASHNPVWIVRGIDVIEIKPDKMPVGKHDRQDEDFTQHTIQLEKGDVIYTLTDGFPDQFGGERGKKFMSKNLRELLKANANLPMRQQYKLLEETFNNWRAELEQVDDVCIIGVRF
ncbi:MAG: two-component regulator propeller domain-containing protein [Bacteroidota bacterium]